MKSHPGEMIDLIGGEHKPDIIQFQLWRAQRDTCLKAEHLPVLTHIATTLSKADGTACAGECSTAAVHRYLGGPAALEKVLKACLGLQYRFFAALHMAENNISTHIPGAVLP